MRAGRNRGTRGEGAFGLIVGLAILIVGGMAAFKIVPLHIRGNEIADTMAEQANFGGMKPLDKIQYEVFRKAQEVGAPLPLQEIKVERRIGNIVIQAKYIQVVDILGYKYTYKFDRSVDKPVF